MSWSSKGACIVVFLTSLLLIFAMGRTNVANFSHVKTSIKEIYEDRLVVKKMIYDLSRLLHQKELAVVTSDMAFFERTNDSLNLQIQDLIKEFKQTYLTDYERGTLSRFESGITELQTMESEIVAGSDGKIADYIASNLTSHIDSLYVDLNTLSQIQLAEGKRKLAVSEKAVEAMKMNQSIEHYSLIVIGILIFIVILLPLPGRDNHS